MEAKWWEINNELGVDGDIDVEAFPFIFPAALI